MKRIYIIISFAVLLLVSLLSNCALFTRPGISYKHSALLAPFDYTYNPATEYLDTTWLGRRYEREYTIDDLRTNYCEPVLQQLGDYSIDTIYSPLHMNKAYYKRVMKRFDESFEAIGKRRILGRPTLMRDAKIKNVKTLDDLKHYDFKIAPIYRETANIYNITNYETQQYGDYLTLDTVCYMVLASKGDTLLSAFTLGTSPQGGGYVMKSYSFCGKLQAVLQRSTQPIFTVGQLSGVGASSAWPAYVASGKVMKPRAVRRVCAYPKGEPRPIGHYVETLYDVESGNESLNRRGSSPINTKYKVDKIRKARKTAIENPLYHHPQIVLYPRDSVPR